MENGDPKYLFIICITNGLSNFATGAHIDLACYKHPNIFSLRLSLLWIFSITSNTPTQQTMFDHKHLKKDQETSNTLAPWWYQLSFSKKSASLQN